MDLQLIEAAAAEVFGTTVTEMHIRTKKIEPVEARYAMFYYFYNVQKLSYRAAGSYFKRDHATVLHGLRNVRNWMETDKMFKWKMDEFMRRVG